MSRNKEYNREEVLKKAATLFWEKGFDATSMSELVAATGLNSASMYKEFGNKEGLFECSLEAYQRIWLEPLLHPLVDSPDIKGIERFLDGLLANAQQPDFAGCLMMNTLAETESVGDSALRRVEAFCVKLKALLVNAMRGAQRNESIPRSKNPDLLADTIICCIHGLMLYGRMPSHKSRLKGVIRTLKSTLRA